MMNQEYLSFETLAHLQRRFHIFLTVILSPLCKGDFITLKTLNIFFKKAKKNGKIFQYFILLTADVVGFYPSIPYNAGMMSLKDALDFIIHS